MPSSYTPVMTKGGHIEVNTSGGAAYALFGSQPCSQLTVCNHSGQTILAQQDGAGVGIEIRDGNVFPFYGIGNANQIGVKRKDGGAAVAIQARWEA